MLLLILFFFFLFLLGRSLQKSLRLRRFKSDWDEFGRIVFHPLSESDFRLDVIRSRWHPRCHFTRKVLPSGE